VADEVFSVGTQVRRDLDVLCFSSEDAVVYVTSCCYSSGHWLPLLNSVVVIRGLF
jgi:hypothetical protein